MSSMYSEPAHSMVAAYGAHHGLIASVIAHLLGAHSTPMQPLPPHPGGLMPFPIHGFGPDGAVTGGNGGYGYHPLPDGSAIGPNGTPVGWFQPASGPPTPPPGVTPPPAGSYNPAGYYRAAGQPAYAAQLWESHHPYAMHHGQIPDWVGQALAKALHGAAPQAAPAPVPSFQAQ